jgi:hypothetical protein
MPVAADFTIISDGKITLKWNSPNWRFVIQSATN